MRDASRGLVSNGHAGCATAAPAAAAVSRAGAAGLSAPAAAGPRPVRSPATATAVLRARDAGATGAAAPAHCSPRALLRAGGAAAAGAARNAPIAQRWCWPATAGARGNLGASKTAGARRASRRLPAGAGASTDAHVSGGLRILSAISTGCTAATAAGLPTTGRDSTAAGNPARTTAGRRAVAPRAGSCNATSGARNRGFDRADSGGFFPAGGKSAEPLRRPAARRPALRRSRHPRTTGPQPPHRWPNRFARGCSAEKTPNARRPADRPVERCWTLAPPPRASGRPPRRRHEIASRPRSATGGAKRSAAVRPGQGPVRKPPRLLRRRSLSGPIRRGRLRDKARPVRKRAGGRLEWDDDCAPKPLVCSTRKIARRRSSGNT